MSTIQTFLESFNPHGFVETGQEGKVAFKILASKQFLTLLVVEDIYFLKYFSWVAVTLKKKKSHLLKTLLIWRQSEWSAFWYNASTNETPVFFFFFLPLM